MDALTPTSEPQTIDPAATDGAARIELQLDPRSEPDDHGTLVSLTLLNW